MKLVQVVRCGWLCRYAWHEGGLVCLEDVAAVIQPDSIQRTGVLQKGVYAFKVSGEERADGVATGFGG